jgi:uncharacterized protein
MKIKISGLKDGIYHYEFEEDPSLFGLNEDYISTVDTKVKLIKNNKHLLVEINSQIYKNCTCDRCLVNFKMKLNPGFKILYSYDESFISANTEDIKFLKFDDDTIDPTEDVRQMIILSVPLKILCNENCKGLCPQCGQNLNDRDCSCSKEYFNPIFSDLTKLKL